MRKVNAILNAVMSVNSVKFSFGEASLRIKELGRLVSHSFTFS